MEPIVTTTPCPTTLQQRASDPVASVWVAANAGSGKTKVLVDRITRLLLEGCAPGHILCLTYTRAAAAEMHRRVTARLRSWVRMEETTLRHALHQLHGGQVSTAQITLARTLFARLLESAPGLRIYTIHGFCEHVLRSFPQEAGIAPGASVLEEQDAQELMHQAQQAVLREASRQPEGTLAQAIDSLSDWMSEHGYSDTCRTLLSRQRELYGCVATPQALNAAIATLWEASGLEPDTDQAALQRHYLGLHDEVYTQRLRHHAACMAKGVNKSDRDFAPKVVALLDASLRWHDGNTEACHDRHTSGIHEAACKLLTGKGTVNGRIPTTKVPEDTFTEIQTLCSHCEKYLRAATILEHVQRSIDIMQLSHALLIHYTRLKGERGALDFDDLILRTLTLLEDPSVAPWVLYKLDGQIEHLLIDEAQDTSYAQWRITQRLCEEFFAGDGADAPRARRLFVVGDEKQSIYSFQGAAPEAFHHQRLAYSELAQAAAHPFRNVPMQTSFRSGEAVLRVVDAVFAEDTLRSAISTGEAAVMHHAYRGAVAGSVTLHPPIDTSPQTSKDKESGWVLPHERERTAPIKQRLAETIAHNVAQWLREGRMLDAYGRALRADDILILLRNRAGMSGPLLSALRQHGVPVAGEDRLKLREHLAVCDLLALAACCADLRDDMALAAVLSSPLYGIDSDTLALLAAQRDEGVSLWDRLCQHPEHTAFSVTLQHWSALCHHTPPQAFYRHILLEWGGMHRFCARMGVAARDILSAFLQECERYSASHAPNMQGFLAWMDTQEADLKRDLADTDAGVRVMTVHGAKGLEAPVVILADTTHQLADLRHERVLTYLHLGRPTLLCVPNKDKRSGIFAQACEAQEAAQTQESLRLLYVAMTRACDELHVFGALERNHSIPGACWYRYIQRGMERCGAAAFPDDTDAQGLHYAITPMREGTPAQKEVAFPPVTSPQRERDAHLAAPQVAQHASLLPRLHSITALALQHPAPPAHLLCTETSAELAAARGTLIHACLHHQCGLTYDTFLRHLPDLLHHLAPDAQEGLHASVVREMEALGEHEGIRHLLEAPALSEAPIAGRLPDGTYVQGRIDRLVSAEDGTLWLLDFKTGTPPPLEASPCPPAYRAQLEAYARLIQPLYPAQTLHGALLYTQNRHLHKIFTLCNNVV